MSRPTKANSIYKVSIHRNGAYRYAATHPYTLDSEGHRKYTHCHWGTVDEELRFFPGKRFLLASLAERKKLIFPPEWDLSEIKKINRKY